MMRLRLVDLGLEHLTAFLPQEAGPGADPQAPRFKLLGSRSSETVNIGHTPMCIDPMQSLIKSFNNKRRTLGLIEET
jgi:hypothetical protein